MKNLLLCATATLTMIAATSSWADDDRDGHHRPTSLTISYVANSLKQSRPSPATISATTAPSAASNCGSRKATSRVVRMSVTEIDAIRT
jgi:hypothetical protein